MQNQLTMSAVTQTVAAGILTLQLLKTKVHELFIQLKLSCLTSASRE